MRNCLLCYYCENESEGVDGYPTKPFYVCDIRELDGDKRFPYKNTTCKDFRLDKDLTSLYLKKVSLKLINSIMDDL